MWQEPEVSWFHDGHQEWTWYDDDWYSPTSDGWVAFSEAKQWWEIEDILVADPSVGKEVKDLYAAFEQKVRTFREARDLVQQKGKSRGYYPINPKGKRYHKGKGKGSSIHQRVRRVVAVLPWLFRVQKEKGLGRGTPVVSFVVIKIMIGEIAPKGEHHLQL